jgi:hypothetical protein
MQSESRREFYRDSPGYESPAPQLRAGLHLADTLEGRLATKLALCYNLSNQGTTPRPESMELAATRIESAVRGRFGRLQARARGTRAAQARRLSIY